MNEQSLEPKEQITHLLEEARMVLPGIQALFGFQLVAVFQQSFPKVLSETEQKVHLLATGLAAVAAALTIAPAAVHRKAQPDRVSLPLIWLASRLLTLGMWPLAAAVFLDFGLLGRIVLHDGGLAWGLATALLAAYLFLWVFLPHWFKTSSRQC